MIYWNSGTGTISVFLKLALLFWVFVSRLRCFPNPKRVITDWKCWVLLQSVQKSLRSPQFFSNEPAKKKLVHCSSLILSLCHIIFLTFAKSHPPSPFASPPQDGHQVPLGLMDVIEPVDDVEEGEDGREDHPGPLIDRVHVRQVWDIHLELGGPSP